jgi:pyridoxal phosphate enzyme (YggS family)
MSIAANLAEIRAQIDHAVASAGRAPGSVRLLAASKTRTSAEVREAMAAGQVLFGENRAQELRDKTRELAGEALEWHFIGALQKNKVKYIVGSAVLVHSVDSLPLAEALSERCLRDGVPPIGVLLQVNLAGEATKSGTTGSDALLLARRIHALPGVALRGLMTIPPNSDDPEECAPWFSGLAGLAAAGRAEGLPLRELSMGMSGDLAVAIRHGATIVRVGTAIFGHRSY